MPLDLFADEQTEQPPVNWLEKLRENVARDKAEQPEPDISDSSTSFEAGSDNVTDLFADEADAAPTNDIDGEFPEAEFQTWYRRWAEKTGIDPDPDNPQHKYDYRKAFTAGVEPEMSTEDNQYHWPSKFKADDHPNRFVDGIDTKTGEPSDLFAKTDETPDSAEPSFLKQADIALGKVYHPLMFYTGLEGLGRLWDLPANTLYGVWEGAKKAIRGDYEGALTEPLRAGLQTLKGQGYYGLEQAGLPVPEGDAASRAAEIAWAIGKNPLNFILPYKQFKAMKAAPPKSTPIKVAKQTEEPAGSGPTKPTPEPEPGVKISAAEFEDPGQLVSRRINKKYRDILEAEESQAPHDVYDGIIERTMTPEALDSYLKNAENKPKAVRDAKGAIADNIGELIETHRYEGHKEGRAIEGYLDQLLEVVKRHDDLPDTALQADRPQAGIEAGKAGRIPDNRGINPEPAKFSDILKSEAGAVEIPNPIEPIKRTIQNLEGSQVAKGAKAKAKRTMEGFSEALHSPEEVYKRDPKTGTEIYKLIDHADQKKNAFLATEGDELVKAARSPGLKIKEGSEASIRVGKALDGKLDPSRLKPGERKLYDFMKGKYDFLIQKYARSAAGSEEGYLKVLKAVNRKYGSQAKVSELSPENLKAYNELRGQLNDIRKGRTIKSLNKEDAARYWETRQQMRDILTEAWKEQLQPGEQQAFDILSRRIKNYLPHIFDQDELLASFKNEAATIRKRLETATAQSAITQYKERLRMLDQAIVRLEKGEFVTYDALPRNVRFRFFESREGKAGYSFDAVKAYQTYLHGIAKKIYDEPAIRHVAELHKDLDPSLKSYNKWYVRRYMGWDRHKLDDLAGTIASFEWMRTLGANPRSAITNLTQRINTVAEVGVKHSLKGEAMGFTKKGNQLFDSTGIAKEVPTVLMEGSVPEGMERARAILGYMFNKVELGNRKHAFLSAYSKAKAAGMAEKEAIQKAVDTVHKTQFRYGKVGMPKVLTHPVGRLAGQFWSYPIKQMELITKWAKKEPLKLVKYLAYAEGGNYALNEFLGIDLSNALGIGLNWGEAIKALRDIPEKDWRGFWRHVRLTASGGGGLLPSGLGPAVSGAAKVIGKMGEGKAWYQIKKELTPVQWNRFRQAYNAIMNRSGDLYPMYDRNNHLMYYLTDKELALRTVGPRPAKESKEYLEWKRDRALEQERREVLADITAAIVEDDMEKANKLIDKYQVVPSDEMIQNEIERRNLTYEEREAMSPNRAAEIYKETRGEGLGRDPVQELYEDLRKQGMAPWDALREAEKNAP